MVDMEKVESGQQDIVIAVQDLHKKVLALQTTVMRTNLAHGSEENTTEDELRKWLETLEATVASMDKTVTAMDGHVREKLAEMEAVLAALAGGNRSKRRASGELDGADAKRARSQGEPINVN